MLKRLHGSYSIFLMNSRYHHLSAGREGFFAALVFCIVILAGLAGAQEDYEAGRGLLTLEGPSGMFINPTSATLPKDAATLQYCIFFPDNRTDVIGQGLMGSYGFTDEFEVGVQSTLVLVDGGKDRVAAGPLARYRLSKDEGAMPQVSVGAYSRLGDRVLNKGTLFVAGYKRLPVSEDGMVRALGVHAGARQTWFDDDAAVSDSAAGYGGLEVQFPLRLYAVGEVTTKDDDLNRRTPYAYGVQWRAAGIAMSVAGIQNGGTDDVSFYYGIGYSTSF